MCLYHIITEVDNCEGVMCHNNGTCMDGVASYTCQCEPDYTGDHCESSIFLITLLSQAYGKQDDTQLFKQTIYLLKCTTHQPKTWVTTPQSITTRHTMCCTKSKGLPE